ncbi:MAG: chorismate synthase [Actinomycetota bacterium]|nr:MAG: chorismate [Actinomycetota bacterium]MDO8949333.1 chorismate synthase [Actinomycetota bacterium]MDP3630418.1 chorismate synthase [Actinomycetota bacterium]
MRYTTAGESHGRALVAIVSDVPAGVSLDAASIDAELVRRQIGYGRGGRMKIESDRAIVLSGVRFGRTIGSPVALTIGNRDWDNWTDVMSVWGSDEDVARLTAPRPGHADLAGCQKTGAGDIRDILERASARETAARVASGAIAKALLRHLGVSVESFVQSIGDVALVEGHDISKVDAVVVEASDVRCPDDAVAARMRSAIDMAKEAGESLGGVFVVLAKGLVPGLGGYAQADQRLDAKLGSAVFSIPAIKGVEFGDGFALAARPGSHAHDAIRYSPDAGVQRDTNRAGGLEGGMTNGEILVVRAAMKPIPTLMTPLASFDLVSGAAVDASRERSDVCAVPAAAVVAEAEVALVLASAYAAKFGGDCVSDMIAALDAYRARLAP